MHGAGVHRLHQSQGGRRRLPTLHGARQRSGRRLPAQLQHGGILKRILRCAGALAAGAAYRVLLEGEGGEALPPRRDPYARHTDCDSAWCFADDAAAFAWRHPAWEPPPFDEYIIYEAPACQRPAPLKKS